MIKSCWVELPLTPRGQREPMDRLVGQLREAGFPARRIRDFCTDASERELYLEDPGEDDYVNRVLTCRVVGKGARAALRAYVEGHPDLFGGVGDPAGGASGGEGAYLEYLLRRIYAADARTIGAAPVAEAGAASHAGWREVDETLRPYQRKAKEEVLRAWEGSRHVMLQMPTGTGKTRLFVSLIADVRRREPGARVVIVTHRRELVEQVSRSLSEHYQLEHGILNGAGTRDAGSEVLVCSIQSLARRMGAGACGGIAGADYIIVDEAHHALAPSYRRLWEAYPGARMLGVTATPCRLRRASFAGLFERLVESRPMREFIREGYLSGYRYYTVSSRRAAVRGVNRLTRFNAEGDYLAGDLDACCNREGEIEFLVDCYETYAAGRRGIVYAVSRSHAERVAERFRERGVPALSIDCGTPPGERARALSEFRAGRLKVLVNVELFTEGFDCPGIGFVLLARPTRSLGLYLQQVGRALRPSPDGAEVVILDAAGLHGRFGLPDRRRDWAAHFKGEKGKGEDYGRALGYAGSVSCDRLLVEVTRVGGMAKAGEEAPPCGWSVYPVSDKVNLVDRYGNAILKEHLLQDLERDADGNWSGWLGTRESGCREGRRIRFTPGLALVPDGEVEVNGCRFHVFRARRTRRSQDAPGVREYALTLDLEGRRYEKVYAWGGERVVMRTEDGAYRYTDRELYPQTRACKVSLINEEPYLFAQEFIAGKNSAGHLYRRLPHGLYLYCRREGEEDVLYDAQLEPLWRGAGLEVLNDGVILRDGDGRTRKVLYLDILFGETDM